MKTIKKGTPERNAIAIELHVYGRQAKAGDVFERTRSADKKAGDVFERTSSADKKVPDIHT
jgi:hypothetical protein